MVKINIKKYSRSNVETSSDPIIEDKTTKRRGRPKKSLDSIQETQIPDDEPEQQNIIHETIEDTETYAFEPLEAEPEPEIETEFNPEPIQDDFLQELNNENYVEPPTAQEQKQIEKQRKENLRQNKKQQVKESKINPIFETSDLFDETGSEIIGKDRRIIINKLNQYRSLFPKELSKFKVKKGASVEELKAYLQEMSTIVECSSYDNFLSDSILQTIKLIEGGTRATRFDVTGMADMLKANPQFNNLLKQLYVKYNVFNKIPPEIQMVLLVSTTAYICVNKNRNKHQLNDYLNSPMNQ